MKQLFFSALLITGLFCSCSTDNTADNTTPETVNYFPVDSISAWTYDVSATSFSGRDSLYIAGETTLNGKTYKKFLTKHEPFGFYSGALNNNNVRKNGDEILVTGATGVNLAEIFPVTIDIVDFIIFKASASDNQQLSSINGTIEQDFGGYPLKIDYTLRSVYKNALPTYNVPNYGNYQDVKVVELVLNLKITTEVMVEGLSTPITATVLEPQDVMVSTHYYAKNIGVVYVNTDITYETQDFSQFNMTFPIPQAGSETILEFLDR